VTNWHEAPVSGTARSARGPRAPEVNHPPEAVGFASFHDFDGFEAAEGIVGLLAPGQDAGRPDYLGQFRKEPLDGGDGVLADGPTGLPVSQDARVRSDNPVIRARSFRVSP
jgi:hypothetical protein